MTWTKLHDLCGSRPDPINTLAIIQRARAVSEEVVRVDDRGYTPLHIAVTARDPSVEVIDALSKANPNAVMEKDLHGDTPLHLALRPDVDPRVIRLLLDANPNVALEMNKEGLLPLHAACRYCPANLEVIRMILEAHPCGLRSRTKMGNPAPNRKKKLSNGSTIVPNDSFNIDNQHLVLDGTTSSTWRHSQIPSTAELQFEERSHQVRDGSFPLHMALRSGAPQTVIEMLLRAQPDVIALTDKFGMTCLHIAVSDAKTVDSEEESAPIALEVVEMLLSLDSKLAQTPDKVSYNLPLHTACQGGCSVAVAKALMKAYPPAIRIENKDGMRPLDVAKSFGKCGNDVVCLLELAEEADMDVQDGKGG